MKNIVFNTVQLKTGGNVFCTQMHRKWHVAAMNSHFYVSVWIVAILFFLTNVSVALAQTAGSLDTLDANIIGSWVHATGVQPDGKIIISGSFTSVLGAPRNNIARINTDGSLDQTFDPNANGEVNNIAVQADGKIILGGLFTTLQPNGATTATIRNRIARLNADGSLDLTFDPNPNGRVYTAILQMDGKILIGGQFTGLRPNGSALTTRNRIARINSNGSLDTSFDPNANGSVRTLALQLDGKILLGGEFTALQPNGSTSAINRSFLARVNSDGSLDSTFDPSPNNYIFCVTEQADGKILLGGSFTTLQPIGETSATPRSRIARVNHDGSLDSNFDPKANGIVYNMALQADGKILLGGLFNTLQPNGAATATARSQIARVNSDGSLDSNFDPKANGIVYNVALQADGKILLGGLFNTLQPNGAETASARSRFALLNNDVVIHSLAPTSRSEVVWFRGGSSPEVAQVIFEQSANGNANWELLGSGTRIGITSNWQLTGISLAKSGRLRARGQTTNGYQNSGSGLIEEEVTFEFLPEIGINEPLGVALLDGSGVVDFGNMSTGGNAPLKTFTITNTGDADLMNLAITNGGGNRVDFIVTPLSTTTLQPNQSATFTVTFAPGAGASGTRTATLQVASNDVDENPFDIALSGTAYSTTLDADTDGMNDWAEFKLSALGFDWQTSNTALVSTYYVNAAAAGLFTNTQVQNLNVGTPLLQRNPSTGEFTLTIGVSQSPNLTQWTPVPMTGPQVLVNPQGRLEFRFNSASNAAFFRLMSQPTQ
jgi:uncharacterized delta-60 repeat protein